MPKYRKLICMISLMFADIFTLFVLFLFAYFLRSTALLPIIPAFKQIEPLPLGAQLSHGYLYAALVIILVFLYEKLYTRRLPFWEETKYLLKGVTISFILIMVLVFVSRRYTEYSRAVIVLAWIMCLFVFPFSRALAKKIIAKFGLWKQKVIILGTKSRVW